MFCKNCGNPVTEDMKFCANCGTPVASRNRAPGGGEQQYGEAPKVKPRMHQQQAGQANQQGGWGNPAPYSDSMNNHPNGGYGQNAFNPSASAGKKAKKAKTNTGAAPNLLINKITALAAIVLSLIAPIMLPFITLDLSSLGVYGSAIEQLGSDLSGLDLSDLGISSSVPDFYDTPLTKIMDESLGAGGSAMILVPLLIGIVIFLIFQLLNKPKLSLIGGVIASLTIIGYTILMKVLIDETYQGLITVHLSTGAFVWIASLILFWAAAFIPARQ